MDQPNPYPEVNALLTEILERMQSVLGAELVGLYLDGSLASGDFDEDSDIDFIAVTENAISPELFSRLQSMHDQISTLDTPWAIQLEGTYLSRQALQRGDPIRMAHPNIERGPGERLKLAQHGEAWVIHQSVLYERGITLFGPTPRSLVDPVPPERLRQAMHTILSTYATALLSAPPLLPKRGYQSYLVLTFCRILYTLQHGAVASKPVAARWAQQTFEPRWQPVIERCWEGRHHPGLATTQQDVSDTFDWIRFALETSQTIQFAGVTLALDPKEIVRSGYDKISYAYRGDQEDEQCQSYHDWLDELLPLISISTGDTPRALDLGCGNGVPVAQHLARSFAVTAVDLSPVQIERARHNVPEATLLCADMTLLEFPASHFAVITAFYSIIHVPLAEQPALLRNLYTWLQPSGLLIATLGFDAWTGTEENWLAPGSTMYWSHTGAEEYRAWLEAAGFTIRWMRFIPEGSGGHTLWAAEKH